MKLGSSHPTTSNGTAICQAECNSSPRYASLAVLNPNTFLGLSLIRENTLWTSSETLEKSVPFGKNSRIRPLVFSLT